MHIKPRTYSLRPLWKSVEVSSVSGGWLIVHPVWTQRRPGLFSRLAAASRLQDLIDKELRVGKRKAAR